MNEFERTVRDDLRTLERRLDSRTARALEAGRGKALAAARKRRLPSFLMPAAGMAAASVVALVLLLSPEHQNGVQAPADDPRLSENVDFYEDLDFYYWLAESGKFSRG